GRGAGPPLAPDRQALRAQATRPQPRLARPGDRSAPYSALEARLRVVGGEADDGTWRPQAQAGWMGDAGLGTLQCALAVAVAALGHGPGLLARGRRVADGVGGLRLDLVDAGTLEGVHRDGAAAPLSIAEVPGGRRPVAVAGLGPEHGLGSGDGDG